jgi:outer membrane receptor protein involved in Fe transport
MDTASATRFRATRVDDRGGPAHSRIVDGPGFPCRHCLREMQGGSTWRAALNITNLFDREPPIVPSFSTRFGTQSVSNEYDVFGRRYQLSMNYDF